MSCREVERLFVAGSSESLVRAHAASCPTCAVAARDHEEIGRLASDLRAPVWSASLREALVSVPARTVSCEMADGLTARALEREEDLHPADRKRLDFHLSRCEACAAAARTLLAMRELTAPEPAPWFAGRMVASAPRGASRRTRGSWRWLLDPKAAIGLAYAAAVVVMLLGFSPADLARKARTDLPVEAKSAVAEAKTTLADRIGTLSERAIRTAVVVKSRVFGYGRAALSNAVQLVMKSEPSPPPSRTRNGNERGAAPKNETAMTTWRA